MIHKVLYVVGLPGIGKTSAIRYLVSSNPILLGDTEIRWTLNPPYAFIGHYSEKMLSGGDQIARHANIMSLEYWKHNILKNSKFKYTIIDGEMFLWQKILDEFKSERLQFIDPTNPKYLPGGLHFRESRNITNPVFPDFTDQPKIKTGCVLLDAPMEVCLSRRRIREVNAKGGDFINGEAHLKTAGSKQLNFAKRFQIPEDPFFLDGSDPTESNFLKIDAVKNGPAEIGQMMKDFLETL